MPHEFFSIESMLFPTVSVRISLDDSHFIIVTHEFPWVVKSSIKDNPLEAISVSQLKIKSI